MIRCMIDPLTERQNLTHDDSTEEYVQVATLIPVADIPGSESTHASRLPDGRWLTVCVQSDVAVSDALAAYDPTSGTSPLVAVARPIARGHLDALLAARGRG